MNKRILKQRTHWEREGTWGRSAHTAITKVSSLTLHRLSLTILWSTHNSNYLLQIIIWVLQTASPWSPPSIDTSLAIGVAVCANLFGIDLNLCRRGEVESPLTQFSKWSGARRSHQVWMDILNQSFLFVLLQLGECEVHNVGLKSHALKCCFFDYSIPSFASPLSSVWVFTLF